MSRTKLFLLLGCLSACGRQLVEFPTTIAVGTTGTTGGTGGGQATAPTVISTLPVNAASAVDLNTTVSATFDRVMDPTTLTTTTFTLMQGAIGVPGSLSYTIATNTAVFTPTAALDKRLVYTATITTGAKDGSGTALAKAYVWSFTTAANAAPPEVIATTPLNLAPDVSIGSTLTALFSKAMDPATINAVTFTLRQGSSPIQGIVTLDGATNIATFTPSVALGFNQIYTATITTGAKDTGSKALIEDYVWTFATAPTTTQPTVQSTSPADLAMNVSIFKKLSATFSKAMDPTTVTALTFTVAQGLTPVEGTVSFDGPTNTATFTPVSALGIGLLYTATINTGAKDTANLPLLADHVWTFTTSVCGQAPLNLGSAANFAVLAGPTITSTGLTHVTGDLGVSPGTAVTGFGPGILVGAQHAGDPTAAQGIADLTTAYNDAAGRTLCPISKIGDIGMLTLTPGLYKSTSSMEITIADLTLDGEGDADAVFIFQIASTLTTTSGRKVILTNGAKAKNIYWQVGSDATIGTGTQFHGTIMADQSITMTTGATLTGRALARIAGVTLDTNTIVKPAP